MCLRVCVCQWDVCVGAGARTKYRVLYYSIGSHLCGGGSACVLFATCCCSWRDARSHHKLHANQANLSILSKNAKLLKHIRSPAAHSHTHTQARNISNVHKYAYNIAPMIVYIPTHTLTHTDVDARTPANMCSVTCAHGETGDADAFCERAHTQTHTPVRDARPSVCPVCKRDCGLGFDVGLLSVCVVCTHA